MLMAIHDRILAHAEELAALETVDTGIPLIQTRGLHVPRAAHNFRFFAQVIEQRGGEVFDQEEGVLSLVTYEPVGVCALIGPWKHAAGAHGDEDRGRARLRQRLRGKAVGEDAAHGGAALRARRGPRARGGDEPRQRARLGHGGGARRAPRHRHGLVHGRHRDRGRDPPRARPRHQGRRHGARRQVGKPGAGRRRPRPGARRRDAGRVHEQRADVPRGQPHPRGARRGRRLPGALRRAHAGAPAGGPLRPCHRDRPHDRRGATRSAWRPTRAPGSRRAARLLAGGGGSATGFERGFFAAPTAMLAPSNDLAICREEIFGPFATLTDRRGRGGGRGARQRLRVRASWATSGPRGWSARCASPPGFARAR